MKTGRERMSLSFVAKTQIRVVDYSTYSLNYALMQASGRAVSVKPEWKKVNSPGFVAISCAQDAINHYTSLIIPFKHDTGPNNQIEGHRPHGNLLACNLNRRLLRARWIFISCARWVIWSAAA